MTRKTLLCSAMCGLYVMGCGVDGPGGDDNNPFSPTGSGSGAGSSSSGSGGTTGSGGGGHDPGSCVTPAVDAQAARPVDLLPTPELEAIAERMPCIADPALVALLESPDTVFYDHASIIPGYQDSYGNGIDFPVGMRPNTINPGLINLAVPGGHGQLFEEIGLFHFPFGNPIQVDPGDTVVIDFWHVPRSEGGDLLPVVWWWYEPSGWTHRIKWSFPAGTVFGELMFIANAQGELFPFEIRTRTRQIDRWVSNAHRPFPSASSFAAALAASDAAGADALIAHLLDDTTLEPASLGASHYGDAFPTISGAIDPLPALADDTVIETLLLEHGFVSAKDQIWKQSGDLHSYAPTTDADFSIVPRNYNAGLIAVSDESCSRCHQDAGRPFKDYYFNVLAYGELWGEDEAFTWHPFETSEFVNGSGDVVSFNDDNRQMRSDFVSAGVLEPYDPAKHPASIYDEIDRPWRNYVHY